MDGPALVAKIDRAIAELVELRAELAGECHGVVPAAANGAGDTLMRLRATAVELGARISGDDRVGEACAAKLLGVEPETLGKQRQEARGPPSYRMPVGGSRISYKLADLAAWVEARREDF